MTREHNTQVPLLNDPCDTVKALSGAGERQHRLRDTILLRGYTMDVLSNSPLPRVDAFPGSAMLYGTPACPNYNCDNTSIPTLTPPAGLVDYPDTLLRESACTPGPMGTRTPLILIHGLDGTSSIPPSSTDLSVFENLSLYLTQKTQVFPRTTRSSRITTLATNIRCQRSAPPSKPGWTTFGSHGTRIVRVIRRSTETSSSSAIAWEA